MNAIRKSSIRKQPFHQTAQNLAGSHRQLQKLHITVLVTAGEKESYYQNTRHNLRHHGRSWAGPRVAILVGPPTGGVKEHFQFDPAEKSIFNLIGVTRSGHFQLLEPIDTPI
jgi:hypothetical protein